VTTGPPGSPTTQWRRPFIATAPARQQSRHHLRSRAARPRHGRTSFPKDPWTPPRPPRPPSSERSPRASRTPYRSSSLPITLPAIPSAVDPHTVEWACSASPNDFAGTLGSMPTQGGRRPRSAPVRSGHRARRRERGGSCGRRDRSLSGRARRSAESAGGEQGDGTALTLTRVRSAGCGQRSVMTEPTRGRHRWARAPAGNDQISRSTDKSSRRSVPFSRRLFRGLSRVDGW
jgi:hypothetical protein